MPKKTITRLEILEMAVFLKTSEKDIESRLRRMYPELEIIDTESEEDNGSNKAGS